MSWLAPLRLTMSTILLAAGLVHLLMPGLLLPAMPPYVPWHAALVLITGVIELAAAITLWVPALRQATAWGLVAYFVAILPAHVHVAWHQIPMFGIRSPALLWGRLLLQSVFILAAYRLTRGTPP